MSTPTILTFAGSLRKESFNKRLARIAAARAEAAGARVTSIDLRDFPLPLFDEDLEREQGLPANARRLKDLFLANQGLLLASPEYNSSISGVLKNTIDWVSRPETGQPRLGCFVGKTAALLATSTGGLGGIRGLVHLRAILGNLFVLLVPDQVTIPNAASAFDSEGNLLDTDKLKSVDRLAQALVELTRKLHV